MSVWDLSEQRLLYKIDWITQSCSAVAFSEDGRFLGWSCNDYTLSCLEIAPIRKRLEDLGLDWTESEHN